MVDIIDEIRDDLQRERLHTLWEKYGKWLVALAVVIVLATGGNVWWNARNIAGQEALGNRYYDAIALLKQGKTADAMKELDALAKVSSKSYPALAGFKQAEALLQENNPEKALAVYEAIATDGDINPVLKELAQLLSVNLYITQGKVDPKDINKKLEALSRKGHVWRFSAQELQASYALKQGDKQKALELYTNLRDDYLAPQGIKERAAEMVLALGGNNSDKPLD